MNLFKLGVAVLLLATVTLTSCFTENNCKQGAGGIITRTISIPSFTGIDFQEAGEVIITQGATQEIVAVGHANVVDELSREVYNGEWDIELDHGCYDDYDLTIYITVPDLNEVHLSGAGHITVNNFDNQEEDLDIAISGSGSISLSQFNGPENMAVRISGSGTISANGNIPTMKSLDIKISGSGNYWGFPISADHCTISIPGSGNCQVVANQTLDVKISGSGSVYYKGHPTVTSDISGSGSVVDAN